MKHLFVIGEKEKHEIEVDRGYFGKITVRVDGKIRPTKRLRGLLRGTFCRLKIGEEEKHEVELKWSGIFPKIRCFVDGYPYLREAIIPSRWEKPIHVTTLLVVCGVVALFGGFVGAYLIIGPLGEQLYGAKLPPYIEIENRNVNMVFRASDGTLRYWSVSIEALESSIVLGHYERKTPKYVTLEDSKTGEPYRVMDFRPFVMENGFQVVIPQLYHDLNNDDQAFVHEVWYIVTQLTTYSLEIEETPRFPLETFIGGGGDCEDMAILIASMLKAAPANYVVKLVYMDIDNPTNPRTVNHVTVWVETPSGYKTFVEGTSKTIMNPFTEVKGWYFEV